MQMIPPPPPPPLPSGGLPAKPPVGNRNALLSDISRGKPLKKVTTNDRSAPIISHTSGTSGPSLPLIAAPPVPGTLKTIGSLSLPPVPEAKQLRSNVPKNGEGISGNDATTHLAGLFSGGIPKLKKREGGIETGGIQFFCKICNGTDKSIANSNSIYTSNTESLRASNQRFPQLAPRPSSGVPSRPKSQNGMDSPPSLSATNLRNTVPNTMIRPFSAKCPPPPVGKKPPATHPGSHKLSSFQISTSMSSAPPSTLPPPPPPPPPPAAPRISPNNNTRLLPPPAFQTVPSSTNGMGQSLAIQAAIRAAGQSSPSTNMLPPTSRPPPPAPQVMKNIPSSGFTTNSHEKIPLNLNAKSKEDAPKRVIIMNDPRWKFRDESMLPKPREFLGLPKKYRAGRGSSVPLDFKSFH
ncbi:putative wasp-interacting protein vrp1p [Erysiphe neolycopersici]|uniref:Putative wasp-interacting protein vrp1p n=1 Tax=Erysiphe neolycopersici TaxID=212602 RepID=A0A420HHS0_9PEZI|nr:putative wasp-interacting protein vrp1p [Erysiphe neolycopersici]